MVRSRLTLIDKLNLFINLYGRLFAAILRFSWWSPFFIYSLFQYIGSAALAWYYAPPWCYFVPSILSLFLPPAAFHYPQYYLALPSVFAGYDSFILGPTVWIILLGIAVYRLNGFQANGNPPWGEAFKVALNCYPRLLLVWFVETVLVFLVLYLPNILLEGYLAGSPNRAAALSALLQTAGLVVSAALLFAVPGIVIDNKRAGEALADSISLFLGSPVLTFAIVYIPSILRIILNFLMGDLAPRIIGLLNPDVIPGLVFIYILVGIFINLFIYGGAVFVYRRLEER